MCETSFQDLKQRLVTDLVLMALESTKGYIIYSDDFKRIRMCVDATRHDFCIHVSSVKGI